MLTRTRLDVRPLGGACGAEIFGVDLAREDDPAVFADIRRALLDHCVIFFRNQALTPRDQIALARRFGEIVVHGTYKALAGHPEIMPVVKEKTDKHNIGSTWHTDMSFLEQPPLGSILVARDVPPYGGDTLFASQYLAYERLSPGMREMLDRLQAVHSDRFLIQNAAARNATRSTQLREDRAATVSSATHPVVRTHDETGRKALYVNFPFTEHFVGMTREESLPLLEFLYAHAVRPEFTCRFRWAPGSIAFWDNRSCQHNALNDYPGFRREMHRITIAGSRPS
ncbi:MAG TPA: TauD/TfdA family dioxygenase [Candidatus Sulfotelmatobacter sp.]|nr:TauD/TfdA family dioxygenase [Candidatus Sulfotelmatobacter sp.]